MDGLQDYRHSQITPGNADCGLRAALDLVAGKWKPLILWHLLAGPERFGALRRAVGPVSEKVLAEQLDQLEAAGILARTVLSEQPVAVEYRIAPLGETLVPVLASLSAWGFSHIVDPARSAQMVSGTP